LADLSASEIALIGLGEAGYVQSISQQRQMSTVAASLALIARQILADAILLIGIQPAIVFLETALQDSVASLLPLL
jgi:hypothetical protein